MTVELGQRQLSGEEGALERHHNLVKVVIKMIVDRGFNFGCHPNWERADTEVLQLEKIDGAHTPVYDDMMFVNKCQKL